MHIPFSGVLEHSLQPNIESFMKPLDFKSEANTHRKGSHKKD